MLTTAVLISGIKTAGQTPDGSRTVKPPGKRPAANIYAFFNSIDSIIHRIVSLSILFFVYILK